MRKALLSVAALAITAISSQAQTTVTDTARTGASYANNVWYSLPNGTAGTVAKNNWDIAFQAFGGYTASILINNFAGTGQGSAIWKYPHADISGWSSVDTAGLSTWTPYYNSETAWENGVFESAISGMDLGWGNYDMGTHVVTGDSIYIVKTYTGSYKKLIIESLAGSVYTFKYANIDGTGEQNKTIDKTDYNGKNFAFYSMDNNAAVDREPLSANWDLWFGQYQASDYAPGTMQGVTGVLFNKGLKIAQVQKLAAEAPAFEAYTGLTFSTNINVIGHDWKALDYTANPPAWLINDSLLYFIERPNGDIWKLYFTGFGGSSTGNFIFKKKLIYVAPSTAVNETEQNAATVVVTPNPVSNGQSMNIVYSIKKQAVQAQLFVYDLSGRQVVSASLSTQSGLHAYALNTQNMPSGMYIVNVNIDGNNQQQKIVIQ